MSANRLIAYQRITGILAGLHNTVAVLAPIIRSITVDPVESEDDETFSTINLNLSTGVLAYNRHWIACQDDDQIRFGVCSVLLQKAFGYENRKGDRSHALWAYAINYASTRETMKLALTDMKLPEGCLYDQRFDNKTAEEIYDIIKLEVMDFSLLPPLDDEDEPAFTHDQISFATEEDMIRFRNGVEEPEPESPILAYKPISVREISIGKMVTSSKTSYFVTMINAKGQEWNLMETTKLDDALTEAQEAADFFGIEPTPYIVDGVVQKPSFLLDTYKD